MPEKAAIFPQDASILRTATRLSQRANEGRLGGEDRVVKKQRGHTELCMFPAAGFKFSILNCPEVEKKAGAKRTDKMGNINNKINRPHYS